MDSEQEPSDDLKDAWPDYMLPDGHPLRSDNDKKPVDTETSKPRERC